MDELDPRLRSLLDAARDEHDPDDGAAQRVRAAIAVALGGGAGAGGAHGHGGGDASPAVADPTQGGAASVLSAGKWLGVLLLAGGIATFAALQLRRAAPAPAVPVERAPSELVQPRAQSAPAPGASVAAVAEDLPPPSAPASAPQAEPIAPPARAPAPHAARRSASHGERAEQPAAPTGPSELTLIRSATQALRDQRAQDALQLLEQHATVYPDGMLRQERQGLRVLSLCALGRIEQGRTERDRFLRSAAHSPLAGRVRAACAEPEVP